MPNEMTVEVLQRGLAFHGGGVLKAGSHKEGSGEFCASEFSAIMRGKPVFDFSDDLPDIRAMNDAFGSNDLERTKCLLPVIAALWDWNAWDKTRRQRFVERLTVLTIQKIIGQLPTVGENAKAKCLKATNLFEASLAAQAAQPAALLASATYSAVGWAVEAAWASHTGAVDASVAAEMVVQAGAKAAAWAAANAAEAAAKASEVAASAVAVTKDAARALVLRVACNIWIEAAIYSGS